MTKFIFKEKNIGIKMNEIDPEIRSSWNKDLGIIGWEDDKIYFKDLESLDIFMTEGFYS